MSSLSLSPSLSPSISLSLYIKKYVCIVSAIDYLQQLTSFVIGQVIFVITLIDIDTH